jgi:hypothetical protein
MLKDFYPITKLGSWCVSIVLLFLAGYTAYQVFVLHTISTDPAWLYNLSSIYISPKAIVVASIFVLILWASWIVCKIFLHNDWWIFLIPALMVICAGQTGAFIGFLIQSMAGLAIGIPIYRRLRGSGLPSENSLCGFLLSWFLGGSVNAYIVWIALHWKINFSYVYFGVAFLEMAIFYRSLAGTFRCIFPGIKSKRFTPGQWVVVLWGIFILPYAFVPSYLSDEFIRHVFFPKQVAAFGQHSFNPANIWAIDTEVFSQSYFTTGYLMGGEYAMRIANLVSVVVAMLLLENYCHRNFNRRTALFTSLVLASTPLLGFINSIIYLEPFNFLSMTAMLVVTMDGINHIDRNATILSFILAAIGYLYKQQAVYFLVPLVSILTIAISSKCKEERSLRPLAWLFIGALSAILIIAPFLAQSFILTKNPFFPWLNNVFHSDLIPPKNWDGIRFDNQVSLNILFNLTFHGEKFWESGSFPFGVNFFILAWFVPFVFVDVKKRVSKLCLFFIFAASLFLWWKITSPNMRYFVGLLSVGAILLGITMNTIWGWLYSSRITSLLGIISFVIAMTVNAASFLNTVEASCSYPLVEIFTKKYDSLGERMSELNKIKRVFLASKAIFGEDALCLLVLVPYLSESDQRIEWLGPTYYQNWKEMMEWQNENDAFAWTFRQKKFDCIIMPQECIFPDKFEEYPYIRLLWSKPFMEMVNVEFTHAGLVLISPKKAYLGTANGN